MACDGDVRLEGWTSYECTDEKRGGPRINLLVESVGGGIFSTTYLAN